MDFDANIIKFVYEYLRSPILDQLMVLISWLGDGGLIWIIISIVLLLSRKYRKIGIMAVASLLLSALIGEVALKHLINRPRPFIEISYLQLLVDKPSSPSFPSSHTVIAFAVVGIIARTISNKLITISAILLACLIAVSRVYLTVHYPTDVVGGIVIGLISSTIIYRLFIERDLLKKAKG